MIRTRAMYRAAGLVALCFSVVLLAHDPRTTSKDFATSLLVGGEGKVEITYKGMHWNGPNYERAMSTEAYRNSLNKNVWSAIGKAHLDFDIQVGDQPVPKGDYAFGILLEPGRKFSLSFSNAAHQVVVPLDTTFDNPDHPYLSIDLYPVDAMDKPELYTFEARCGQFRGVQMITVMNLLPHEHTKQDKKSTGHSK
ncbi:MAG: hypothetical protein PHX83_09830 [Acidobacteriia bacterium]|nr:hypothetical protein [Terriglobia bacterium]